MTTQHQQWEYHRLYLSTQEDVLGRLTEVGDRGWELVSVVHENGTNFSCWFYFKRPKQ